ncbi:GNAT family N-acetyltransferase [Flavobacterium sp.]|uniref:GNAT family N-acetyltransferase n=1 Tax=Flavobacterium sp. TaxID=239 RepID=UPI0031D0587B
MQNLIIKQDILFLREVKENDTKLLFNWANDMHVRKNAINQDTITWEKHIIWFEKKMNSSKTQMFILSDGNNSFGQIRIDEIDSVWHIDYSIDYNYRGQGLGTQIVNLLLKKFKTFKFKATVKKYNEASSSVFIKLGFKQLLINDPDFAFFEY